MATGQTRYGRIIPKKTAVSGKLPTGTTDPSQLNFLKVGEIGSNLTDYKLWGYNGSTIFEYGSKSYLSLTGGTVSGDTDFLGKIFSGGTDLYDIFLTSAVAADITRVQSGVNTYTGGTGNLPTVNVVDSPSFNNIAFSGIASGGDILSNNISGTTFYSGDTDLSLLFSTTDYFVTGGTASSGGTLTLDRNDGANIIITGLASSDQIITQDSILDIYQTGTTTTSGGAYSDIVWDSESIVGADYSYAGAEITILSDGYYEIVYSISVDVDSGGRKTSRNRLVLDEGGGYNEITRTATYGYHRNTSSGTMSLTKNIKQQFSAGDKIKAQVSRDSGSGDLITVAGDSNITITKLAV